MTLQKTRLFEIIQLANLMRIKYPKCIYTNYYNQFDVSGNELFDCYKAENLLCFGIDDNGVYRLFFYSTDISSLNEVLLLFPKAIIEYIYVGEKCNIDFSVLKNLKQIDSFKRYHSYLNGNEFAQKLDKSFFTKYLDNCTTIATPSDFNELKTLLFKVFDLRVSHLPSDRELLALITNENVVVCKQHGEIKTFWFYKKEGKRIYSYEAYNCIQGIYIQSLWYKYFCYFAEQQFREVYGWVSDKNFFSLNLHYKFNFTFDRQKLLIFETI